MLLIDSNIIIDHLRGKKQATYFLESVGKANMFVSTVIEMELYNGVLDRAEFVAIRIELFGIQRLEITENISQLALQLSKEFALSHHMSVADTLIAATALVYDLELRTLNIKDFRFIPNLKVSNSLF
ncbi:type II toxin-antitoxin system VapC family toxin [Persicitalea sp.]|uniref:type II toxin-antitoxin system VapC family toxin n=1 Tax=Persicitalea sp. TaxID=3100273 RepID=UPI0035933B04